MTFDWRTERSRNGGVDLVTTPTPGSLWLCGKHFVGPDHQAAMERVGADVVVCLNERHELVDRYPEYVAFLDSTGAAARWWPIPDLHAPGIDEARRMVDELDGLLGAGSSVLLHCGAGIGRAGTMAAALLIHHGHDADQAVATVAAARPTAGPEAGAQRALLDALARRT